MKKITFLLSAFFATTFTASAVTTISVSNLDQVNTNDNAIVDNSGVAIALGSGSIGVGYFSSFNDTADFSNISVSSLLGDFQSFGSGSQSFANSFNAEGFFSAEFSETINNGDSIIGQTLFTVIGNNTDLSSSSEFLVFRHDGVLFEEEVAGLGGAAGLVQFGAGSLLLGEVGDNITVLGTEVGSFRLAAVPEPSSSALLALAGVGFVLRRRR